MTIYQEEMQRKAQRYGCITDYGRYVSNRRIEVK